MKPHFDIVVSKFAICVVQRPLVSPCILIMSVNTLNTEREQLEDVLCFCSRVLVDMGLSCIFWAPHCLSCWNLPCASGLSF